MNTQYTQKMMKTRIQQGKIETAENKTIRDIWGWWGGVHISDILKITNYMFYVHGWSPILNIESIL